ncbi:MAG: M20/M25/M40 family metallo-hydrolase [Planctomycetes bacterium]|nr:M20/M25/M40 family metallo-hydrolase [Planctomycetota bacterium]
MTNTTWPLETLKKYLSIPSVSAQGTGIKEACRFLKKLFTSLGLKAKIIDCGGNPICYAELIIDKKLPTLLFYNHYDVQPPEPLEKWISPPFNPAVRGGKLFARGSSDNKGNLTARLSAVKSFLDRGAKPPVNVKFVVDGEEEIGSPTLPRFINKYRAMIKADMCIWESGGRDEKDNPDLSLGCKGICHAELVARGAKDDLHSSKGVIVKNPAWRLIWALNSLKDSNENILIKGFYDKTIKPGRLDKNTIAKFMFYEKEKKAQWGINGFLKGLSGIKLKERFFYEPALNIDGLTSGYQGSGHKTVLPKQASVKIDFRLVPDMTPKDILNQLRNHLNKYGFNDIEIHDFRGYPPARTPLTTPYLKIVRKAQERVYKKPVMVEPLAAASGPMYLFTSLMPCFSLGVGHSSSSIHAPNENIRLDDYRMGIECIAEIMHELASAAGS